VDYLLPPSPRGGPKLTKTFLAKRPANIYPADGNNKKPTFGFNASSVAVSFSGVSSEARVVAFQLYYSLLPYDKAPYLARDTKTLEYFASSFKYKFASSFKYDRQYDCSVDYFPLFRKHLDCSGEVECEGGEDEGDHCHACQFTHHADTGRCPFCPGGVDNRRNGKCYSFERVENLTNSTDFNEFLPMARETCRLKEGRVAFLKNILDIATISLSSRFYNNYHCFENFISNWGALPSSYTNHEYMEHIYMTFVGMIYGGLSTPNLYRQMWISADRSVSHSVYEYKETYSYSGTEPLAQHLGRTLPCAFMQDISDCATFCDIDAAYLNVYYMYQCSVPTRVTCEFELQPPKQEEIKLHEMPQSSPPSRGDQAFMFCPQHHLTHAFLRCDTRALCGQLQPTPLCSLSNTTQPGGRTQEASGNRQVASSFSAPGLFLQFAFENGKSYIPYTLVCDFRPDCQDQSDKAFCGHPPCVGAFTYRSGQCVPYVKRGDLISDCFDDSDEIMDEPYTTYYFKPSFEDAAVNSPYVIQYKAQGYFTKEKLGSNDTCPDTHFRCPGPLTICMPVYTRCNGYFDCEGRQDEDSCDNYQCPGFYRCLDSQVCVHPDYLCDGWPQCPQRDDEWLCRNPCPHGCVCDGLAFVCVHPFPSRLHPQLRYLDGSGSGISPVSLQDNVYLVCLVLSHCQLKEHDLINMANANLRFLDLSKNLIEALNTSAFLQLLNLQTLLMAGNPLTTIYKEESSIENLALQRLDLSSTKLATFNSETWKNFPSITTLNLSTPSLQEFTIEGLKHLPLLEELDITSSPLQHFPTDVFLKLSRLKKVRAENYKLCCRAVLPSHLDQRLCQAEEDEVSSCDDLLRSGLYRVFS
jgi:hypothetical protein